MAVDYGEAVLKKSHSLLCPSHDVKQRPTWIRLFVSGAADPL